MSGGCSVRADYAFFDKQTSRYVLGPPVIPAQENHPATETWNLTFELAYDWQRQNLPCYLPGNGGLLYAMAMMKASGFPADGSWTVNFEN